MEGPGVSCRDGPSQSPAGRGMLSGRTPSVISLCEMPPPPKVEALAKAAGPATQVNALHPSTYNQYTFPLCQSLSLSGEVARPKAVTERVACGDEPSQSRFARQLVPLFVAWRRHLPPAGGSLSTQGGALGKEGESRPHPSTAGRNLPLSCKLYAFAKASPFRERWHGQRP